MLDSDYFVGWPNRPDAATHLRILQSSYRAYVAIDMDIGKAVGFINAISDGVLSAYIPLLEVLPDYQGRGIGGQLVRHLLDDLKDLYMVDIVHDKELAQYYAKFGAASGYASIFRNYNVQSGKL